MCIGEMETLQTIIVKSFGYAKVYVRNEPKKKTSHRTTTTNNYINKTRDKNVLCILNVEHVLLEILYLI